MTRALLYTGRVLIGLDLVWIIFTFGVFVHLERFNTVEAVFFEFMFGFFHAATLVSMLYLTERKKEHSTTDYRLLNLDWKNAPLLMVALLTDLVALTRSIRSTHTEFAALLTGLSGYALGVTVLAIVWFVVAVCVTRKAGKGEKLPVNYQELPAAAERVGAKNWHSLKN